MSDGEKEVYKTPNLHARCKRCEEGVRVSRRIDTYFSGASRTSHSPPILVAMCGCGQDSFYYTSEAQLIQAVESGEFRKDVMQKDSLEEAE